MNRRCPNYKMYYYNDIYIMIVKKVINGKKCHLGNMRAFCAKLQNVGNFEKRLDIIMQKQYNTDKR